jgi:hypothetical protein
VRTLLADLVNSLPDFSAIFNLEQFALWRFMGSADFTMYSLPAIREYISVLQQNDLSMERHRRIHIDRASIDDKSFLV